MKKLMEKYADRLRKLDLQTPGMKVKKAPKLGGFWGAIWNTIMGFFAFLGQLLGFSAAPTPTPGYQNIQKSDVAAEAELAAQKEAAIDELQKDRSLGEIVFEYAGASEDKRSTVDIGALSYEQQDWLLRLSDADLVMLKASGIRACAKSLDRMKVIPDFKKIRGDQKERAPQILEVPMSDTDRKLMLRSRIQSILNPVSEAQFEARFS